MPNAKHVLRESVGIRSGNSVWGLWPENGDPSDPVLGEFPVRIAYH
jgi:hypothetical protein